MKITKFKTTTPSPDEEIRVLQLGEGRLLRTLIVPIIGQLRQNGWKGEVAMTNLRPSGKASIEGLCKQKGRYNVVLADDQEAYAEEIGFVVPMDLETEWDSICKISSDPRLSAIISNSTEKGFQLEKCDFNIAQPSQTFIGTLTKLLYIRYEHNVEVQLSIFPTELIPKNGDALLNMVTNQASFWNLDNNFIKWINRFIVFRNTLVDRIVTLLKDEEALSFLQTKEGYADQFCCLGEKYGKWWIEAPRDQLNEFPLYSASEVELVADTSPYQKLKLWILNGAHLYMACVGLSMGFNTVDQVANNQKTMETVHKYWNEAKGLIGLPEDKINLFIMDTERRFKQAWLNHRLTDIAVNINEKWKIRIGSFVEEYKIHYGKQSETAIKMTLAIAKYVSIQEGKTVEDVLSSMASSSEFLHACLSTLNGSS